MAAAESSRRELHGGDTSLVTLPPSAESDTVTTTASHPIVAPSAGMASAVSANLVALPQLVLLLLLLAALGGSLYVCRDRISMIWESVRSALLQVKTLVPQAPSPPPPPPQQRRQGHYNKLEEVEDGNKDGSPRHVEFSLESGAQRPARSIQPYMEGAPAWAIALATAESPTREHAPSSITGGGGGGGGTKGASIGPDPAVAPQRQQAKCSPAAQSATSPANPPTPPASARSAKPPNSARSTVCNSARSTATSFSSCLSARWYAGGLSTPTPGSYDDGVQRDSLGQKSRRSFNSPATQGKANFWSHTPRSALLENDNGDPGAYADSADAEFVATRSRRTYNKEHKIGKASFNSITPRGDGVDFLGSGVGPQKHDYPHLWACGRPCTPMRSSFKSATALGQHVRKTDNPGVGDYTPEKVRGEHRGRSKRGSSMFADGMAQHSLYEREPPMTEESVGPGSYHDEANTLHGRLVSSRNPRLPPFSSSASRSNPTNWV